MPITLITGPANAGKAQVVLDAVKDALLVAARKHYRTNENYICELNEKTGSIDLFAVKKVVDTVENSRRWEGTLASCADGQITLEVAEGKTVRFPFDQVEKANLKFEWGTRSIN